MTKIEILSILESLLGVSRQTSDKDDFAFFCPYCKHYKRKLEVNLTTFQYHCWTCNPKRGGKNFYYLCRSLPTATDIQLEKIREYTNTIRRSKKSNVESSIRLPDGFKTLTIDWPYSIEYRHAMVYLRSRGVTDSDIRKYDMGFCESGEYAGRIIIPSYSDGVLTYFVARTFFDDFFSYKNPKVSKNVIFFENLIAWKYPIVLCEGVFDAIAIRRNAIPLLGKSISEVLLSKIKKERVSDIYVCLDLDARKEAMDIAEILLKDDSNRNVYLIDLPKKDPAEIGFKRITEIIKNTKKFDLHQLVYKRLFE